MKTLVLTAYNHFEIQDWPIPEIAPDEVLLKVAACGICGSDVHGMDGSTGRRQPPIVMGHEAAGVIAELGGNVEKCWNKGDRVTFDSTVYCNRCWFCCRGQINLCDNRRVLGVACDEYRRHGAFAEFVAVPQHILYRLPDGVTFQQAVMVEPLSIALHAVRRTHICLDDTAVVVGAGMIGLLIVQALRVAGCGRIIAVDIDQSRLDLACKLGADEGLRSDQNDVRREVLERTGGRGADVTFEAVGITPTVQLAVACLRKGGQLTLVGNIKPMIDFPLQAAVTRELTINGSCASCGEYPACLDLMARGTIQVDPLISATAPLSDGAEWFRRLKTGKQGLMKVILEP
jgi:L-iditol 2-dehydrogenase